MKTQDQIIKKRPLIIGLGLVLGLSQTELQAAPDTAQTEQAAPAHSVQKPGREKKIKKPNPANTQQPVPASKPQPPRTGNSPQSKQPEQSNQTKNQTAEPEKTEELSVIKVVSGRSKDLIGMKGSASEGLISQEQIEFRGMSRPGELVELIPGMIATQHSGSGKANQYFLRGYNLDHGTDFTTIVDGVPMNLPTHAHGQGYMDLNSMIPELVEKIDYGKGPYYAEVGDFSAAGFNKMTTMKTLPQGFIRFTGGEFDYYRTVAANSSKIGDDGNLLYGAEFQTYNGAWAVPENGHKYNGLLRYTQDHDNWGMAINAKAYTNTWTATNQLAQYAMDGGYGIYGNLSPSDGGDTNRVTLSTNVWSKGKDWKNDANLYAVYYDLDLFSNFSGYMNGPQGDQMQQKEHRVQIGGNEELTHYDKLLGFDQDNTFGMNFQINKMTVGLNETVNRQYLNTMSLNNVNEETVGAYWKNQIHWNEKFRTIQALRADVFSAQVNEIANGYSSGNAAVSGAAATATTAYAPSIAAGSIEAADPALAAQINAANSGSTTKAMLSPKFSAIMGPWYDTEYFFNVGYGYHSNDARGTVTSMNPDNQYAPGQSNGLTQAQLTTAADGSTIRPVPFMSWARGGEIGARSNYIPGLNTTVALWWLQSSSELVFDGDSGTTTANGMSDRYGIELTNYYKVNDWLTLDLDISKSDGHFVNTPQTNAAGCPTAMPGQACTGNLIPNLVGTVIAAGVQVVAPNGMFGSLRLRHFGDSPLDSNGTYWSPDVNILNLGLGYKQKTYKLDFSIFNLLGQETSDIAYAYSYSSNPNNQNGTYGIVRHPVEPRMARAGFTIYF